jgi:hypothetical protein
MQTSQLKSFLAGLGFALLPCAMQAQVDPAPAPAPVATTQPDPGNLRAFIELARSDIRTMKTAVIAENLPLTYDEAAEFWPVQREYEFELNKLVDERLALIMKFGPSAHAMTDEQAKELAKAAFDLEDKRTALKRTTFEKMCEVVPAAKAARFFQVENQLNALIDLRLAAELPLIK